MSLPSLQKSDQFDPLKSCAAGGESETVPAANGVSLAGAVRLHDRDPRRTTPEVILQAQETFQRDLPELLASHYGQCVAYHGGQRIAIRKTKAELYHECERLGLKDFLTRRIRPRPETDYISAF